MEEIKSTEEIINEIFEGFDLTKDEIIRGLFEFNEVLKVENSNLYKENERLRVRIYTLRKRLIK